MKTMQPHFHMTMGYILLHVDIVLSLDEKRLRQLIITGEFQCLPAYIWFRTYIKHFTAKYASQLIIFHNTKYQFAKYCTI